MPSPEDWEKGGSGGKTHNSSVAFASGVGHGEQEEKKVEFRVPEGIAKGSLVKEKCLTIERPLSHLCLIDAWAIES